MRRVFPPLTPPQRDWRLVAACAMACLLAFDLSPPADAAGSETEEQLHGIYEAVELKPRELSLLETAGDYEELFVRRGYRYQSPEFEALMQRIGSELAPEPTDSYLAYRFFIFDDPIPNAFALPDGQIYVNTGMLAMLDDEAQLAAILGHEIAHSAGHHGILSFRKTRKKMIWATVLGDLGGYYLVRSIFGYNRILEAEADQRAFDSLLAQGYDVRAVAELFTILGQDIEGDQPAAQHPKWSTMQRTARRRTARAH